MKIIIGNQVFHANKEPILVVLNREDKYNITNMDKESHGYLCYPSTMEPEEVMKWGEEQMGNIFLEYGMIGKQEIEKL